MSYNIYMQSWIRIILLCIGIVVLVIPATGRDFSSRTQKGIYTFNVGLLNGRGFGYREKLELDPPLIESYSPYNKYSLQSIPIGVTGEYISRLSYFAWEVSYYISSDDADEIYYAADDYNPNTVGTVYMTDSATISHLAGGIRIGSRIHERTSSIIFLSLRFLYDTIDRTVVSLSDEKYSAFYNESADYMTPTLGTGGRSFIKFLLFGQEFLFDLTAIISAGPEINLTFGNDSGSFGILLSAMASAGLSYRFPSGVNLGLNYTYDYSLFGSSEEYYSYQYIHRRSGIIALTCTLEMFPLRKNAGYDYTEFLPYKDVMMRRYLRQSRRQQNIDARRSRQEIRQQLREERKKK